MTIESAESDESENFKFFGLGGCNEVGRSCHIIEYKNKVIMLDAGVHPALSGHSSFPFYDEYDLSKVDLLLISHFHLDHAASLPYVMQHTNFKGKIFMTHATKAIYRWLLQDFVRVTSIGGRNRDGGPEEASSNLYTDDDIISSFDRIETVDYHSTMEIDGIRFTAYHAGHVLGACMYFIEIGGLKVLFTGDYSREENRHLHAAEVPPTRPDILISESTFGTGTLEPKADLEKRLTQNIHATIVKGGRVLMPVFSLGNAQELLLILDEYWENNEDLQNVNIYFASNLAKKCMAVYQTYTSIMNDNIRLSTSGQKSNPFDFKYIRSIKDVSKFQDFGPSVVVASPGMLQAGVSRQLLEKWAPDPKNLVVMTGYSVEGTMAKELLKEPHTIQSIQNPDITIPRRINIEEISFAAHVDFQQNSDFIEKVAPSKIILVHGDSVPMGRLKSALLSKYSSRKGTDQEVKVFNPKNCEEVKIPIKGQKIAKVLGTLAEEQLMILKDKIEEKMEEDAAKITEIKDEDVDMEAEENEIKKEDSDKEIKKESEKNTTEEKKEDPDTFKTGQLLSGVLVSKDFDLNLLQLQDLHEYTQLSTSILKSKMSLKINADISLMKWHLEQMFGFINILNDDEEEWECLIMEVIDVIVDRTKTGGLYITVEWINDNLMSDSLADSVIAILYSIDSSPASVKLSSKSCSHNHKSENGAKESTPPTDKSAHANSEISSRIHRISSLLKAQFGDSLKNVENDKAVISIGKNEAKIDYLNLTVECGSRVLRDRIETIIKRGSTLAAPLSQFQKAV
ncbi:beta-lactamase-like protein [Scheffersomyces xylosifermentans]|uniref:beta-lactamase-like protein n=1 Tax=Scheffersomyces xylosifermentans TaxID=1304137 RepID=UPI00315D5809